MTKRRRKSIIRLNNISNTRGQTGVRAGAEGGEGKRKSFPKSFGNLDGRPWQFPFVRECGGVASRGVEIGVGSSGSDKPEGEWRIKVVFFQSTGREECFFGKEFSVLKAVIEENP